MEQLRLFTLPSSGIKTVLAKWKILVVDDEIGMGESLRLLMSRLGYEVSSLQWRDGFTGLTSLSI